MERSSGGLEAVFLGNRATIERFLRARGAGDSAQDLLQELWLKCSAVPAGPLAEPMGYIYRAAENLMRDRFRAGRSRERREQDWSDGMFSPGVADARPTTERSLIDRERLRRAESALAALGSRAELIFRRCRLDGVGQKQVAAELGVSLSTVEKDLRRAVSEMANLKARFDAE